MSSGSSIEARIAKILDRHEYRFGHDTNCFCGAPGIWVWADYREHVASVLVAELGLIEERAVAGHGNEPIATMSQDVAILERFSWAHPVSRYVTGWRPPNDPL